MKKYFINKLEVDKKTFMKKINFQIDELASIYDSQALAFQIKCALNDFAKYKCFELDGVKFQIA